MGDTAIATHALTAELASRRYNIITADVYLGTPVTTVMIVSTDELVRTSVCFQITTVFP